MLHIPFATALLATATLASGATAQGFCQILTAPETRRAYLDHATGYENCTAVKADGARCHGAAARWPVDEIGVSFPDTGANPEIFSYARDVIAQATRDISDATGLDVTLLAADAAPEPIMFFFATPAISAHAVKQDWVNRDRFTAFLQDPDWPCYYTQAFKDKDMLLSMTFVKPDLDPPALSQCLLENSFRAMGPTGSGSTELPRRKPSHPRNGVPVLSPDLRAMLHFHYTVPQDALASRDALDTEISRICGP